MSVLTNLQVQAVPLLLGLSMIWMTCSGPASPLLGARDGPTVDKGVYGLRD